MIDASIMWPLGRLEGLPSPQDLVIMVTGTQTEKSKLIARLAGIEIDSEETNSDPIAYRCSICGPRASEEGFSVVLIDMPAFGSDLEKNEMAENKITTYIIQMLDTSIVLSGLLHMQPLNTATRDASMRLMMVEKSVQELYQDFALTRNASLVLTDLGNKHAQDKQASTLGVIKKGGWGRLLNPPSFDHQHLFDIALAENLVKSLVKREPIPNSLMRKPTTKLNTTRKKDSDLVIIERNILSIEELILEVKKHRKRNPQSKKLQEILEIAQQIQTQLDDHKKEMVSKKKIRRIGKGVAVGVAVLSLGFGTVPAAALYGVLRGSLHFTHKSNPELGPVLERWLSGGLLDS